MLSSQRTNDIKEELRLLKKYDINVQVYIT